MPEIPIEKKEVSQLVQKQIEAFFLLKKTEADLIEKSMDQSFDRIEKCFAQIKNKYYSINKKVFFNPYQSSQYCIFLYFLANTIWNEFQENLVCDKLFYLNKTLNSIDLFYKVEMPAIFYLDHPVGSVIGRGKFADFFQFRQNCTVGNNKGYYPEFGRNVHLWSGVTIVGKCLIGDNVTFASGCYVKDQDIPANSYVFGRSPALVIKEKKGKELGESDFFHFS